MSIITDTQFEREMPTLKSKSRIAVAVSGGVDSLLLSYFVINWAKKVNVYVTGLTVNHGLRKEAKAEVQSVLNQFKLWNTPCECLMWTGKKPIARIEEKAREARYNLLLDYCKKNDIQYLFLAHHQNDQIETFFARLSHSSGIKGLGGIKKTAYRQGICLYRPLLSISKQDILDTAQRLKLSWSEDSMNKDTRFERVRWRQFLPKMYKNGLSATAIQKSMKRLERAQEALDFYVEKFWQENVKIHSLGYITVNKQGFSVIPSEIQIGVLQKALNLLSDKQVNLDALERVIENISKNITINDCLICVTKKQFFICKEFSKMPAKKLLAPNIEHIWGNFAVETKIPLYIQADSAENRYKGIPYLVQKSFPSFKDKKGLEISFNFDYKEIDKLKIRCLIKKEE